MKDKKINLDILRLIASFMIIAIHIYPFSSFNKDIDYIITRVLFRIAVPFFLMITGFYILKKSLKDINILKKYTKKIIKLYLISILIYIPINIYNNYFINNNILEILKDIFINGTFYHLWYFPSLIIGLWITYFLIKKFNNKTIIILIILYIIGLFGDNYYGLIKNMFLLNNIYKIIFSISDYTRNGIFYTPIFLYMGTCFNKNKINYKENIILIIVFVLFMLLEGILLYKFNIPKHSSMYIFLIPLMYLLFNIIIFNKGKENKKIRNYSTWIYILHPMFLIILRLISKILKLNILINNSFICYILVSLLTISFIVFINGVMNGFRKRNI